MSYIKIYAVQWHPESNAFDRDHRTVDHSTGAVRAMQASAQDHTQKRVEILDPAVLSFSQWAASFFTNEARMKGVGPGDIEMKGIEPIQMYPTIQVILKIFFYHLCYPPRQLVNSF